MANLHQVLAPGGSLLLTGPVASPSADDLPTDAWRLLPRGLELLARCVDDDAELGTFGYGIRVSAVGSSWDWRQKTSASGTSTPTTRSAR